MTQAQIAIIVLLATMLVAFSSNRFRFELVALCGLAIAGVLGLVASGELFSGFANPTVITVLEILLIVQVLKRSHLVEMVSDRLGQWATGDRAIITGLCAIGALLSVCMNNIGALALMIPVAMSVCERNDISPAQVMMPLSFATLLGGLCSVVGTPANLIGSVEIGEIRGTPLGFFELALVGVPLVAVGLLYFWFVTPDRFTLINHNTEGLNRHGRQYVCEIEVQAQSALVGLDPAACETLGLVVHNIVRGGKFVFGRNKQIATGDVLIVEIGEGVLTRLIAEDDVLLVGIHQSQSSGERFEAVVLPESIFLGSLVSDLESLAAIGVEIEGVGITPRRVEGRLADMRLAIGDILLLRGEPGPLEIEAAESGLLLLKPRATPPSVTSQEIVPPLLFAGGVLLSAVFGVPPEFSFGLVVLALALSGSLSLRQGFEGLNWPILIMLGAMIPLGNAVATTGAAGVMAQWAVGMMPELSLGVLVGIMLVLAVLLTPFVNNPSTVLVLLPIGIEFARQYGLPAGPVVIAIVVGASLDFLTPFGHHNNSLVMGVGGYSFSDYLKLGAPLVIITTLVAAFVIPFAF